MTPTSERPGPDESEPRVGRAAAWGAVVGFLVTAPAFALLGLVAGADVAGALALGGFVGVWGGCGWGGMLAASFFLTHPD